MNRGRHALFLNWHADKFIPIPLFLLGVSEYNLNMINWRLEKKFTIFFIVFGTIALVVFLFVYFSLPEPTCFDGKQNQDEEGADCGGSCTPCVKQPKDIITLWTRTFSVKENVYDVAALIENPNVFYGLSGFKYIFKVYNSNNVMVAVKEGKTFLSPQDKFVILETGIKTTGKLGRVFMDIDYSSGWKYIDREKPAVIVSEKKFVNFPFPTLQASLYNQSIFPVRDVYVAGILYDEQGNAIGASTSKLDEIKGESRSLVTFTWPEPFEKEPVSSEILIRVDLVNSN